MQKERSVPESFIRMFSTIGAFKFAPGAPNIEEMDAFRHISSIRKILNRTIFRETHASVRRGTLSYSVHGLAGIVWSSVQGDAFGFRACIDYLSGILPNIAFASN